jgi:hypothetical protein
MDTNEPGSENEEQNLIRVHPWLKLLNSPGKPSKIYSNALK